MKKHLRIIAVLLLAVIMMVGMTFTSSAAGDDNEKVSFGNTEFLTEEELTPTRIVLLVVAAASLVVALCVKPVDRWTCASESIEEPAVEPVGESIEEPIVEPVYESIEEPTVEPLDESIEEPTVEPVNESIEEPVVEEPVVVETEQEVNTAADGQVILVSYRSSFMSRLIQAETDIQDYYTVIKNTLLSYKGVKARSSWNFESFNKTRVQCAKLTIKGKAILLYLNLDTEKYSATKYHFQNVGDKPKFADVPMFLKIKSERGLKYALELIEELMTALEIPFVKEQDVDYRVPFETNEALAERGLVKVILPKGVELGDNVNLVQLNVSELLDEAKTTDEDDED
jgi:hypothetical protein